MARFTRINVSSFTALILVLSCFNVFASSHHEATIKLLGVNDFHGQINAGRHINSRPAGSAPVLLSYLKQAQSGMENNTIITMMGDQTGASPPASGLLRDEPTIMILNSLANQYCHPEARMDARCNMVATIGNHEFDKGQQAMHDLIYGSNKPPADAWIPLAHFPGASFPYISANIVDTNTKKLVFPPYVIKKVNGVTVAFIGAISQSAPEVIVAKNIEGIEFLNEAQAINRYIPEVKKQGAEVVVVLIHEGGNQNAYEGDTKENSQVDGRITSVVNKLDDAVDVVMAGHVHQFMNAMVPNEHGKKILVTEANSYSTAFAEVTLHVDLSSHTVTSKSARIITAYADQLPGTNPDAEAQRLLTLAEEKVAPIYNKKIGTAESNLTKSENSSGESTLGNLIADAFRNTMKTDMAFFSRGGIRADLPAGTVTWGNLYTVLPFSNYTVKLSLTGQDIFDLLEQQWSKPIVETLKVSGLTYVYNTNNPIGQRVISASHDNKPLEKDKNYTVCVSNFLAGGGDGFTVFKRGIELDTGMTDLEAVIQYIQSLPQPFSASIEGRMRRENR